MSPVGHACFALIFARKPSKPDAQSSSLVASALFLVLLSWLPDFAFVPGILAGAPYLYHRGIVHTPAFALMMGLVTFAVMKAGGQRRPFFWGLSATAVILSHIFLDFVCSGPSSAPMWLWPFSHERISPQTPLLSGLHLNGLSQIFGMHNAIIVASELLLAASVFIVRDAVRAGWNWVRGLQRPGGYVLEMNSAARFAVAMMILVGAGPLLFMNNASQISGPENRPARQVVSGAGGPSENAGSPSSAPSSPQNAREEAVR